jgi:hypothetical protein
VRVTDDIVYTQIMLAIGVGLVLLGAGLLWMCREPRPARPARRRLLRAALERRARAAGRHRADRSAVVSHRGLVATCPS